MPYVSGGGSATPRGAAGGDLGGTYPNPTVTSGAHLGAKTVPIAALADPTTGKVIGSAANAPAAVFPPGFELDYVALTSDITIASTTEATGTTVITSDATTFDGAAVMMEFCCQKVSVNPAAAGQFTVYSLFEGATQIARLGQVQTDAASAALVVPVYVRLRFTPTAASHTYTITAFKSAAGATVDFIGGAGGTGAFGAGFLRFSKV